MNGDHENHDGKMEIGYKEGLGSEKKAICYVCTGTKVTTSEDYQMRTCWIQIAVSDEIKGQNL